MKGLILVGAASLISVAAHATTSSHATDADADGKLALTAAGNVAPGDIIAHAKLFSILYANMKCQIPIANAKNMWRAEQLYGNKLVEACWGMPLSPLHDKFNAITKFGNVYNGSIYGYKKVRILSDGSAKVIGPAISQADYQQRVQEYEKSLR